jgi:hypothetical protein
MGSANRYLFGWSSEMKISFYISEVSDTFLWTYGPEATLLSTLKSAADNKYLRLLKATLTS